MPEETRWLSRTALDGILAQKADLGWTSQKPVTAVCWRGRRASLAPCEGSRRPCWGLCVLPHHFSVSLSLFQNGKFIFEGLQAVSLGIPPNKAQAREKMLTSVEEKVSGGKVSGRVTAPGGGWNHRDRREPCWWAHREAGAPGHTGGRVTSHSCCGERSAVPGKQTSTCQYRSAPTPGVRS